MTEEKKEIEQAEDIKQKQETAVRDENLSANKEVKPEAGTANEKKPAEKVSLPESQTEQAPSHAEKPAEESASPEPVAVEVPKQEDKIAVAAAKPETGTKKNKKIKNMSLKEIDAKLKAVKEKMGNLQSRYAKQLLKQKNVLDDTAKG